MRPPFKMPQVIASHTDVPEVISAYVPVRGAQSLFATHPSVLLTEPYRASAADRTTARHALEKLGFIITGESAFGLAVHAPAEAFEELTGGTVTGWECLTHAEEGRSRYVTRLNITGADQPQELGCGSIRSSSRVMECLFLDQPRMLMASSQRDVFPAPNGPRSSKFHLRVPEDLVDYLRASSAHQQGLDGSGILVAMPDSGWYQHPYFIARRYQVRPPLMAVASGHRSKDPIGHGTGESANLLAVAPGCTLQPIRCANESCQMVGALAGFLLAKEQNPRIITCSWGSDSQWPAAGPLGLADRAFAVEIRDAIERGMLVVFAAGNGQFALEPQVPGVLAAGGCYVSPPPARVVASDYCSGYPSPWFSGVRVPTVCGLVGMQPRAQYLMLPVPPRSTIDRSESEERLNDSGDGTAPDDGWALFSGTSAAAPQLAGAAALILQARPGLRPGQVIQALTATATDVPVGAGHPRFAEAASMGLDVATGAGLVNVSAAVQYAMTMF